MSRNHPKSLQPDLIPTAPIPYTLFFTSRIFNTVLDLLSLFDLHPINLNHPYCHSGQPGIYSVDLLTTNPTTINSILSLLPLDTALPPHLQNQPLPDPYSPNTNHNHNHRQPTKLHLGYHPDF